MTTQFFKDINEHKGHKVAIVPFKNDPVIATAVRCLDCEVDLLAQYNGRNTVNDVKCTMECKTCKHPYCEIKDKED